jgi:hypothetical protein
MNWNGQREYLDHLIAKRADPDKAADLQAEFDAKRRKKIMSALTTRPVFLPLQFNMNAAGQIAPYRDITTALGYDVIITGVKADRQTREIIIRRTEDEKPIVYVGDDLNLKLRLDEIAGQATTLGGGQLGVFYLPSPIILPANSRLTVEMFKTDATAGTEQGNIVLVGLRAFRKGYGDELLDGNERSRIDQAIQLREIPALKFLKQAVTFSSAVAGGVARNLFTPQVEEPLLIRGVRTNLRQSLIDLRVEGEPNWTVKPTPIWGVAGEDDLTYDNYQWFSKPIYLHSRTTVEIQTITNSIDNVNIDAQNNNFITWICETV